MAKLVRPDIARDAVWWRDRVSRKRKRAPIFRARARVMSTTSFSTPDKILGAAALASRDITTISSATWSKGLIDDTLVVKCRSRARQRRGAERADEVASHGSERIGAPCSVCASVLRSTDRQCHHRVDEAIIRPDLEALRSRQGAGASIGAKRRHAKSGSNGWDTRLTTGAAIG